MKDDVGVASVELSVELHRHRDGLQSLDSPDFESTAREREGANRARYFSCHYSTSDGLQWGEKKKTDYRLVFLRFLSAAGKVAHVYSWCGWVLLRVGREVCLKRKRKKKIRVRSFGRDCGDVVF